MIGVSLPEEKLTPLLTDEISLAAVNSTSLCVVSGTNEAIVNFREEMKKNNIQTRPLYTSHAFHSKMMNPILKSFEEKVKSITLNKPLLPYISNVSGDWIKDEEAVAPAYWAAHLGRTVRFSRGAEILLKEPGATFVEVGPGRTLGAFVKQNKNKKNRQQVVNLMRHPRETAADDYFLLNAVGQLWLYGIEIDWSGFYAGEKRYRVSLPTYAFAGKYYWFEKKFLKKIADLTSMLGSEETTEEIEVEPDQSPVNFPGDEYKEKYEPPRNDLEQNIARVWQEILGFEKIGIYDNFFYLNGDSLTATELISRVKDIYPVEISLEDFFQEPTVSHLAEVIKKQLMEKVKNLSEEELEKLIPRSV
jgi:acyl transferase domain-containing protein